MVILQNVTRRFGKDRPVLEQINLEIGPGHIYGLLGKNGAGKSTLLKILSGLLFPDEGVCRVKGEKTGDRRITFLQNQFFFPEENEYPDVKVNDYFLMKGPFYPSFRSEIACRCLESFGISSQSRLRKMSMGERKKAALSLALAVDTPYLWLDEPTNGLDIPSKSVFRRLMASTMTPGRTVIISTHQVRDLENLIDAVIVLDRCRVVFCSDFMEIEKRLFFGEAQEGDAIVYAATGRTGKNSVLENTTGRTGEIDMELLFETVVSCPEKINEIFSQPFKAIEK